MCPTALPTPTMASEFTADERVAELTDQLRRSSSVRMPAVFPLAKQKRPRTASQSASALPALADAADARDADEGSLDSRPPGTAPVGSRSMSQRQKDALQHLAKMVADRDALPAVAVGPGEGDLLSVTSLSAASSAHASGDRRKAQGAALLRRMSVMQERQGVLHAHLEVCRRKHIEGAARIAGYEEALVQSVADKAMRADERRGAAESAGRAQVGLKAAFAAVVAQTWFGALRAERNRRAAVIWRDHMAVVIQELWRRRQAAGMWKRAALFLAKMNGAGGYRRNRVCLHLRCWRRTYAAVMVKSFLVDYIKDCAKLKLLALMFYERVRKVQRYAKGFLAVLHARRGVLAAAWDRVEDALMRAERDASAALKSVTRQPPPAPAYTEAVPRLKLPQKAAMPGKFLEGRKLLEDVQMHSDINMKLFLDVDVHVERTLKKHALKTGARVTIASRGWKHGAKGKKGDVAVCISKLPGKTRDARVRAMLKRKVHEHLAKHAPASTEAAADVAVAAVDEAAADADGGKNLAGKAFSFEDAKKWIEQLEEEPPAEGDGERGGDGAEKGLPRERMSSDTRPAAANEDEWTGNFSRFPHLQFYGCFGGAEGMLLELREEIQKARVEHRRKLIEHERRIAAGEVDADVSDSEL